MTREEFFERFELIAEMPGAVARMRRLILRLAIEGELATKNSADEPAAVLLARIERDLVHAGLAKRLRNSKALTSVDLEPLFKLPVGWEWSQLGRLAAADDGAMCDGPFGSKLKTEHYIATRGYAVVRLGNIGVGKFIWGKEGYISGEHFESLRGNHLAAGDLLVAGLADPLVRCCEVPSELGPAVNKADCFRVRIHPLIDRTFIRHYLNSPVARVLAAEENHGMTRERINLGAAKSLPIPVPPLAEQKRIVAKVDELMALCDRLEAQQKERETRHAALARASLARFADAPTPANLTFLFHKSYTIPAADLRKSILTLAIQGKLIPKDHNDVETAMVSMEELVGKKNLKNGLSLVPTQNRSDFVCLPLSAMKGSTIDCSIGKPIALSADRAEPYLVKRDDIFIMRGNGSKERVGLAGMVRSSPPNVLFPDLFIHVPLPTDKIDPAYFVIAWNSSVTREMLEGLAKTTSGIWKINQGHISECEIPLPPLAEQRRIVAKVDQLMALVDELETQLAASRATAAKLLDAIVGELTT
jgi:type I restriction enzyme S subunit